MTKKINVDVSEHLRFVRYCINEQQCIPTITEWHALFLFMKEQALLGVEKKEHKNIHLFQKENLVGRC